MILDRSLGMVATEDLCESAGKYIDQIKLSFGTALLYSDSLLRRKIELIHSYQISACPGGTLFEIAFKENSLVDYYRLLKEVGFKMIEVSDGSINLPREKRKEAILRAQDAGFVVFSEVGKKDPKAQISISQMVEQIQLDFESGSQKVIIEARESGTGVGIYDGNGTAIDESIETLIGGLDEQQRQNLIWEAPLKQQQIFLLGKFGEKVNLGNIPPQDALGLEALRCGLRWDTLSLKGTT